MVTEPFSPTPPPPYTHSVRIGVTRPRRKLLELFYPHSNPEILSDLDLIVAIRAVAGGRLAIAPQRKPSAKAPDDYRRLPVQIRLLIADRLAMHVERAGQRISCLLHTSRAPPAG